MDNNRTSMTKKRTQIKGWISSRELTYFEKTPIEKANGSPIILEIWKDGEDMRACASGVRIVPVEVLITPLKKK